MNILSGKIIEMEHQDDMTLVKVDAMGAIWTTIVIDKPQVVPYLKIGCEVNLMFKETEVIIGKGEMMGLSLQNQVITTITQIEKGKLLSRLTLLWHEMPIISIITTHAVDQLKLAPGDQVKAMVKTNEIMLSPR